VLRAERGAGTGPGPGAGRDAAPGAGIGEGPGTGPGGGGEAAAGHLAMLLFSALVAGSFSLGALAANEISPLALTAARFVIATVLVGALLAARGQFRVELLSAAARLSRGEGTLMFSFFVLLGASALLLLAGVADLIATPWRDLPAIVWVTLAYVSVAATAVSVVLLQYASLRLPASKVMAYTYLLPSWVILWEVALGRPLPAALVFVGVGMSVLALGLLLRAR
jgi:drug/metabolite transporter (DMT)-like permease